MTDPRPPKLYEVTAITGSPGAAKLLKAAIQERVDSERNLFFAEKITARKTGVVEARVGYALPRGTATPTHIREMVDAVAWKAQIDLNGIDVVRVSE